MPSGRMYVQVPLQVGSDVQLDRDASHYVHRVLRLKVGDQVIVFNGRGGEYEAHIDAMKKDQVTLVVGRYIAIDNESPLIIHLAMGLIRGDRMDFAIQKSVELGVGSITPLLTERTNIKIDSDRLQKRTQHWQAIAVNACEQSGRCVVPDIHLPVPLMTFVDQQPSPGYIADPENSEPLPVSCTDAEVTVLVGPEGGFSLAEIQQLHRLHWRSFSMGKRILRAETAAMMSVAHVQWRWGDA